MLDNIRGTQKPTLSNLQELTGDFLQSNKGHIINLLTGAVSSVEHLSKKEQKKISSRTHLPSEPYPLELPYIYTELLTIESDIDKCLSYINGYIIPMCNTISQNKGSKDIQLDEISMINAQIAHSLDYYKDNITKIISDDIAHPYILKQLFQTCIPELENKVLQGFIVNYGVNVTKDQKFQFVTPLHGHPSLLIDHVVPDSNIPDHTPLAVELAYSIYDQDGNLLVDDDGSIQNEDLTFKHINQPGNVLKGGGVTAFHKENGLGVSTPNFLDGYCNPHSVIPLGNNLSTINTYLGYGQVHSMEKWEVSRDVLDSDTKRLLKQKANNVLLDPEQPFGSVAEKDKLIKAYHEQH